MFEMVADVDFVCGHGLSELVDATEVDGRISSRMRRYGIGAL